MPNDKLRNSVGRRHESDDSANVLPSELLNIANDAYDGDNGETRMRREAIGRVKELEGTVAELETALTHSIVPSSGGMFSFLRFRMSRIHLISPDDVTPQELNALGHVLADMDDVLQFWIGDWANLCLGDEDNEQERGKIYQELETEFGIKARTIQNYASVCRNLPPSLRREGAGFSIHRMIAELPEILKDQADAILDVAADENMTVAELKGYIAQKLEKLSDPKHQPVTDDSFLFSKNRIPKINSLQQSWLKAKNGDKTAKSIVLDELANQRKWLDEIEESLED